MEDTFGVFCRLLILAATGAAVVLQVIFVLLDCQFLSFTNAVGNEREFGLFSIEASTALELANGTSSIGGGNLGNLTGQDDDHVGRRLGLGFSGNSGDVNVWDSLAGATCVQYDWRAEENGYVRTAQVSALLAVIGGGVGFLLVFFEACCLRVCCARLLELAAYGMALLFSGFTYFIYLAELCDAHGGCSNSRGGTYNYVAIGLYVFSAIIMCCTPKPKPLLRQMCCGGKDAADEEKQQQGEAVSVGDQLSPANTGTLQVEEGAWGATPHGRTQYE